VYSTWENRLLCLNLSCFGKAKVEMLKFAALMARCLTNNLWKFQQKILNYFENNEIFVGGCFFSAASCILALLCALLRSHFLNDFHQNWHRRKNPKSNKKQVQWVNIAPPFLHFASKATILRLELLKIHANINNPIYLLKILTSDFKPEVEMWPFHACTLLFWSTLWMCIENLKCVALAVPEIIAIGVLVGGCEP